ncbi:hypothetical protein D3C86_1772580 [compost metagenome]
MLALGGFAFGMQLAELRLLGGDSGVLPRAREQRQIEAELHAHHVAERVIALLVGQLPAPVGLFVRHGLAHLGLRFIGHGIE